MNLAHDNELREMINVRMGEVFNSPRRTANLNYSGKHSALIKDAAGRGMVISSSRLSKYLNGLKGGITEDQILWIATRLGVFINVGYGKPVLNEGKLSYEVTPYNESESLTRLAKIFPNTAAPVIAESLKVIKKNKK